MKDWEYFIDFDGVILDSQDRFVSSMKNVKDLNKWVEYLSSIAWNSFLRECNEIDDSITVLKELQKQQKLKAIITSIHSFTEGKEKQIYLREKNIMVPIIYVLPEQKKSSVYIPNKNQVLVDDKIKNCIDWELSGGKALLFDSHETSKRKEKIKSLKQLL